MQKYETMYILQSQLEEAKTEELIEKFKSIVEREGGEVSNLDKWGKRKLAYEVKKQKEGFYVLMNYTAPSKACDELERSFKIAEEVLRYLIVREED
ncbi:30S ribosomal protein S6 [Candidatus Contubernalis alkaliaceticus]|uniref:30S ribosomal protein S6 n=1 Tax=Candidatus Contubernalis alkaliaceticus TaxID=338645 RepID=UPI001F4C2C5C|nr:30S ribosomal protein S6 [Candidatus Contubernalis alkalaceticus]UNC93713.1 30S ribosomal protein S6 [Candidatus Contubernalis alkalaceticus]